MEKNFKINKIGEIVFNDKSAITINKKYIKALKNLNGFSHIHLYFINNVNEILKLDDMVVKINELDEKKGIIYINNINNMNNNYSLIDIKPYMPSEDSIKEKIEAKDINDIIISKDENDQYILNEKGLIRNVNNEIYIDLKEPINLNKSYIKVYWWFNKFDSKIYREVTECNPPYENAPRSGIFSTRSPVRPNPIAITIVKVNRISDDKKKIYINDIEAYDKTPCIGIMEYDSNKDYIENCIIPSYLRFWPKFINDKDYNNDNQVSVINNGLENIINSIYDLKKKERKIIIDNKTDGIFVKGARENNLKGIDVTIPYNKITAVVGVSGSGKSSLVNDTIYQECKRKMEFLNHNHNILSKPKIDYISGCIPSVMIKQDTIRGNSLSTIGTYINAYDYLRIIFAQIGIMHCPDCNNEIIPLSKDKINDILNGITDYNLLSFDNTNIERNSVNALLDKDGAIYLIKDNKKMLLQISKKCYNCNKIMFELTPQTFSYVNPDSRCPVCNGIGERVIVDVEKLIEREDISLLDGACSFYGKLRNFIEKPNANWMKGQVFGLASIMDVDLNTPYKDLTSDFKNALLYGLDKEVTFSYNNTKNGRTGKITRKVEGLISIINRCYAEANTSALDKYMKKIPCDSCNGERLNKVGRLVTVDNLRYPVVAKYSFIELEIFLSELENKYPLYKLELIENSIQTLREICESAKKLGIAYLHLDQVTSTLSGGEAQRLKLLGVHINHMSNILYIFDEPSKGLDPRDYGKIQEMFDNLIKEKNTILMVEHNEDMIKKASNIIEVGPGAGVHGGNIVGSGSIDELINNSNTQIYKYLNREEIHIKKDLSKNTFIEMNNLHHQNLKNINIKFPKNALTCIYGVSGSGKSSLMKGEIYPRMIDGTEFNEVVIVDQSSIGKNSKSIIATYISIMDDIRKIFANTKESIENQYTVEHFSFNNEIGQCPTCKGDGRIEVKFMDNSYVRCPDCNGMRYKKDILKIKYHEKNIFDIFNLSITEGINFFIDQNTIINKLSVLEEVGLGYLKIGQSTSTLSGGEASRLKIASKLIDSVKSSKSNSKSNVLYLLDEPTTGLHFSDIENLLKLINSLLSKKNTVIAIEHNRRFLSHADWLIELGPKASNEGGEIMYIGENKEFELKL